MGGVTDLRGGLLPFDLSASRVSLIACSFRCAGLLLRALSDLAEIEGRSSTLLLPALLSFKKLPCVAFSGRSLYRPAPTQPHCSLLPDFEIACPDRNLETTYPLVFAICSLPGYEVVCKQSYMVTAAQVN